MRTTSPVVQFLPRLSEGDDRHLSSREAYLLEDNIIKNESKQVYREWKVFIQLSVSILGVFTLRKRKQLKGYKEYIINAKAKLNDME